MSKLTQREQDMLTILNEDHFMSPGDIGSVYGIQFLNRHGLHSSTASPVMKRLVEKGLVERNDKGHYRRVKP